MMFTDIEDLWIGGKTGLKGKYLSLMESANRPGIKDYLNWLSDETDFFTAPASAKNHNNYECGLVEHSLMVLYNLVSLVGRSPLHVPQETITIIALTHDVCKANFYAVSERNNKVNGTWIKEPYYSIDDKEPLGHGEKSVIIMQRFIRLSPLEVMAIRWHMGGFDSSAGSYEGSLAMRKAFETYPLCAILHFADHYSTLPDPRVKP